MTNSSLAAREARLNALARRSGLADLAVYTAPDRTVTLDVRVFIDRAQTTAGELAPVFGPLATATILRADVPAPEQGATLEIGLDKFTLDAPVSERSNEVSSVWTCSA